MHRCRVEVRRSFITTTFKVPRHGARANTGIGQELTGSVYVWLRTILISPMPGAGS